MKKKLQHMKQGNVNLITKKVRKKAQEKWAQKKGAHVKN